MKVRWLGNSCVEVFGDRHILIDPNFLVEPMKEPDLILVTHEHDDHFDLDDYGRYADDVELLAPRHTLNKFDLIGKEVEPGMYVKDIKVLDCQCWNAEESVSYHYKGVLHSGDSNVFPDIDHVELLFTACFPEYYDDYVSAAKRLGTDLVVPFHYDPDEDTEDPEKLVEIMKEDGIQAKLINPGDSVDI